MSLLLDPNTPFRPFYCLMPVILSQLPPIWIYLYIFCLIHHSPNVSCTLIIFTKYHYHFNYSLVLQTLPSILASPSFVLLTFSSVQQETEDVSMYVLGSVPNTEKREQEKVWYVPSLALIIVTLVLLQVGCCSIDAWLFSFLLIPMVEHHHSHVWPSLPQHGAEQGSRTSSPFSTK